jgi:hypothetical protein
MYKNKKAISETTSFILLTLLVVIFSSIAYFFLNDQLEESNAVIDRNNMEKNLKKFDFISRNIIAYDNSTISIPISFNSGALAFSGNQLIYQSEVVYEDTIVECFDSICYVGSNGFERIFINLSSSYSFSRDFSLNNGDYILILTNNKNDSEIKVSTR